MLAAIVHVTGIMTDEEFLQDMQGSFKHKFAKKPEVIEGNMKALEMALKQVNKKHCIDIFIISVVLLRVNADQSYEYAVL